MEDTAEQRRARSIDALRPYQYKKGQSGNPSGRSKKPGESLKEYAKRKLAGMTPKQKEEYMNGLNKDKIWEMAEGTAPARLDVEVTKKLIDLD